MPILLLASLFKANLRLVHIAHSSFVITYEEMKMHGRKGDGNIETLSKFKNNGCPLEKENSALCAVSSIICSVHKINDM